MSSKKAANHLAICFVSPPLLAIIVIFAEPGADIILSPVDTLFSFALRTVMSKVSPKMFPAVNGLLVLPAARG